MSALLSLIDPFDILAKHGELTLALHPMKIPDGYQIAGLEELGLWSTSQSSLWILESSPEDRSQLSAVYTLRLYSFY